MKIRYSTWYTTPRGSIGIIVVEDKTTQELKAYIGQGIGIDQFEDEQYICAYGARFPLESALDVCGVPSEIF